MKNIAVLLAGGVGARVGLDIPKQLIKIAGRPIMEHTLAALDAHPKVDEIIVLMAQGHLDAVHAIIRNGGYTKVTQVLEGAATRNETTLRAIRAVVDEEANLLFHDAVRPMVTERIITEVFEALEQYDAVDTAIPSADTIVELGEDGTISAHPAPRPAAARSDPAGVQGFDDPPGLCQGRRGPRVRGDRRLHGGAALHPRRSHRDRHGRRPQHEGHRADRRLHRRQAVPAHVLRPARAAHRRGVPRGARRQGDGRLRRLLRHRPRHRPSGPELRLPRARVQPVREPAPTSSGASTWPLPGRR